MKCKNLIVILFLSVLCVSNVFARRHIRMEIHKWDMQGKSLPFKLVEASIEDDNQTLNLMFYKKISNVTVEVTSKETGEIVYTNEYNYVDNSLFIILNLEEEMQIGNYNLNIYTKDSLITGSFNIF